MVEISSDITNGLITISDKFDLLAATGSVNSSPSFLQPGDEYSLSFLDLQNVKKLTKFTYDTVGLTDNRYLLQYYRVSRDGVLWTEWLDLTKTIMNFPEVDPLDPLYVDIKWVRKGASTFGAIKLLEYKIEGQLERPLVNEEEGVASVGAGSVKVIKPPFIYKIFKITDIETISSTGIPIDCIIKYRYSQDNSRTWSNWETFNKGNMTTVRINPIRFFQIEYLIENNSSSNVVIEDINLIGDFQNVTLDSRKTNLYGIRECCQSNLSGAYDENGYFIPNSNLNQNGGASCDTSNSGSSLPQMTTDEKAQLYNPYAQNGALNLLNKLSNDAQQVFGHQVIYFVVDPDKGGIDTTLHEYQLYNVACKGDLKISVEGNNFPDSQIIMNQFDLNLFQTMEVHITKQQFKEVFGVQRRPAKEDFLYFCNLNRMYQVDHAQQFRGFNNNSVYYKLILKKFNNAANIKYASEDIKNTVKELTKNSTIDELFGIENNQDKLSIANKQQFTPLTRDPIRLSYSAQIEKELIENSSTIIAKAYYDLASVTPLTEAVTYLNLDALSNETDNTSFFAWFNINNYIQDEVYNLFDYYNNVDSLGYKINLINDDIILNMNSYTYSFHLTGVPTNNTVALNEETWYCYLLNIDQRNSKVTHYIYKRDVDDEDDAGNLSQTILQLVYKYEHDIIPIQFEAERFNPRIFGSDMKITNIRLFADIIPENVHHKILNQYIIGDDSKYLIFADNATTRLYLPKFPLFE
jgi:hypothetical protein